MTTVIKIKHFTILFPISCLALKKKLTAAAKLKRNKELTEWIASICNHLYWSVISSKGDTDLAVEKWLSVCRHVANIHEHEGQRFPKCVHGTVDRKWLKQGT